MRTPVWITIVVVAGIVVAWLVLTRAPEPKAVVASEAHAPAAAAPVKREETPPPAPATIPPPAPAPVETKPPPAPVAPPSKAAEPAGEPATDDAADAPADDGSGDEPETTDVDTDAQSLDPHRAADLLADWMAKDDVAATGEDATPSPSTEALKTFDHEDSDPHWSAQTAQQIQSALDQWLDALPDELRDHVDVIHVECRMSLCQILAAENDMTLQDQRAQASRAWPSAISTLSQQAWWIADGFSAQWTSQIVDDSSGYQLYQTYLRRQVGPSQ